MLKELENCTIDYNYLVKVKDRFEGYCLSYSWPRDLIINKEVNLRKAPKEQDIH